MWIRPVRHARLRSVMSSRRTLASIPPIDVRFDADASRRVSMEVETLVKSKLLPLNHLLMGPLDARRGEFSRPPMPFALVLGNHSAGKSTWINYMLGRDVQETGVAPTDDGFTIIASGPTDRDQDGPSLVGDPDLGFASLESFGVPLVNHLRLKIRSGLKLPNVMLVDSPGMIDSPTSASGGSSEDSRKDRGYDFEGAVRWLAERADVILFFFDPDKPGTTGESLSVFTKSLSGLENKVSIVFNKCDRFERIHDFARAMGALAWNLGKVIPRKDFPRIYTTYVPSAVSADHETVARPTGPLSSSLKDLEAMGKELAEEVTNAPLRRLDNIVSHLKDATSRLLLHASMFVLVRQTLQQERRVGMTRAILGGGIGIGCATAMVAFAPVETYLAAIGIDVASVAGSVGYWSWYNSSHMAKFKAELVTEHRLDDLFERKFRRELREGDEHLRGLWNTVVRRKLINAVDTIGIDVLPKVSSSEIDALERILKEDVPRLRRSSAKEDRFTAAKTYFGLVRGAEDEHKKESTSWWGKKA